MVTNSLKDEKNDFLHFKLEAFAVEIKNEFRNRFYSVSFYHHSIEFGSIGRGF